MSLEMWIVYDHPADYPEHFVARKWTAKAGAAVATMEYRFAKTLDEIRQAIPQGLHRFPRNEQDEPQVVETWF